MCLGVICITWFTTFEQMKEKHGESMKVISFARLKCFMNPWDGFHTGQTNKRGAARSRALRVGAVSAARGSLKRRP